MSARRGLREGGDDLTVLNPIGVSHDKPLKAGKRGISHDRQGIERQQADKRQSAGGLRSTIALTIALLSLAVAGIAWFWTARLAQDVAMLNGVIAGGIVVCVTSVIAYVRGMDLTDVFEMLGELFMGVFALIGAILKGIWSMICGIFGWD